MKKGDAFRVTISLDSLSTFTNIYTRNIWMIFLSPSIDGSMDRWVEYGKIVSIVVGKRNGRAGRPPPPRSSRARGNYDFESNKYLQSLCAGHVTGGERERDIEGRREEQSCNERSTAAKLAIAYYIIHEWRSFRRARIGPGDSFFCHRRRDCEKQKQHRTRNLASFSNKLTTYAASLRRASLS